ncbi:hypothetical protein [Roseobacter sp. HKCCA0434]|uniref:hypothetical protein n=1 Tax=Roseobacter sp. HKCCA0434 TaxID=3079297 RepID=UPI0029057F5A|nr:hypothetical protein [Roseobacter sp. HKCCA0434]
MKLTYRSFVNEGSPVRVDFLSEESTHSASVLLGCRGSEFYFCEVSISPTPGFDPDTYTLTFVITCLDEERADADAERILDSYRGRKLIPPGEREKAIAIFGMLTNNLLDSHRPRRVEMCAYETNLPDKALEKYHIVCDAARRAGYEAGAADSYRKQAMWIMVRRNELEEAT